AVLLDQLFLTASEFDLAGQLVLRDGPFTLDRHRAPLVGGAVRLLLDLFPGRRAQCALDLRFGPDGHHAHGDHLDAGGGQAGVGVGRAGAPGGGARGRARGPGGRARGGGGGGGGGAGRRGAGGGGGGGGGGGAAEGGAGEAGRRVGRGCGRKRKGQVCDR